MQTCDAHDSAALLPYDALLDALRAACVGVAQHEIICPQRQAVPMASGGTLLSMIAVGADLAVHKLVTVVPLNAGRQLPTIQGEVSVWNSRTGAHVLSLDGATVTGRRTAALSMLGVSALRTRPPKSFRIFGTGTQALHHVEAIGELYPAAKISVSGRTPAAAEEFCRKYADRAPMISAAKVPSADQIEVVITCTSSLQPVYERPHGGQDPLVIAIGAFSPDAAEIGAATVRASHIYVDTVEGARNEAGDLIRADVDWRCVRPLAQCLSGAPVPEGPVLFKTVGLAAWDLAAARVAMARLGRTETKAP